MSLAPARRKSTKPQTPTEKYETPFLPKKVLTNSLFRTLMRTNGTLQAPIGGQIFPSIGVSASDANLGTPGWYAGITIRPEKNRSDTITLRRLKGYVTDIIVATASGKVSAESHLRAWLLQMSLIDFNSNEKTIIKQSNLLTNGTFTKIQNAYDVPADVRDIAKWLFTRWWAGDTDPNLLRGIKRQKSKSEKTGKAHTSYILDTVVNNPFRVSPNYVGAGKVHNG